MKAGVELGWRFVAGIVIVAGALHWAEDRAYRAGWDDGVEKFRDLMGDWLDKRAARRGRAS